jgi:hypothetical protein
MSGVVDSEAAGRKANRRTLFIILGAVGAFVLLLIGLILSAVDLSYKHFGYSTAAKKYRDAGLPWTAADLSPKTLPAEKNGYHELTKILVEYKESTKLKAPAIKDLLTPSDYSIVREYLAERNGFLNQMHTLSQMEYVWDKDWDQGASLLFPEFADIKNLVKDLVLRAEYRSAQRDIEGAAADLKAASGLANAVSGGPTIINGLVHIACRSIVFRGLQRSASFHLQDAAGLRKLQASISALETPPDLYYHMQGEAYLGLASLRNFNWQMLSQSSFEAMEAPPVKKIVRDGDVSGIAARSFAVPYLELWTRLANEVKSKGTKPQQMMEISAQMDEMGESARGVSSTFVKIMFPVFAQAGQAYAKTEADYLTAKWGIEAAISRAEGRSAAAVSLPVDPFGTGPLKLKADKSRLLVWSLGINRSDEGGLSLDEARSRYQKGGSAGFTGSGEPKLSEVDLVFELPYRRHTRQ